VSVGSVVGRRCGVARNRFHCTKYQHIRKNTVESALDILKCSKKSSVSDNFEFLLLSPSIDSITKSQNRTVKDLLFEFLSGTKRTL